ncbi:MAG: hypothetical protein ACQKBT_08900 [Puniceicoccales bacterium]
MAVFRWLTEGRCEWGRNGECRIDENWWTPGFFGGSLETALAVPLQEDPRL